MQNLKPAPFPLYWGIIKDVKRTHTHKHTHQSLQNDDSSVLSIQCFTQLVRKTRSYGAQINLSISRFNSFFLNFVPTRSAFSQTMLPSEIVYEDLSCSISLI